MCHGSIWSLWLVFRWCIFCQEVPGAASRARTSKEKMTEEQLVQDLTRHGPLAQRIGCNAFPMIISIGVDATAVIIPTVFDTVRCFCRPYSYWI